MWFWSKFGGAALMVGGVAAAGATGGASLSLVGAGANMISNDVKKDAAKKAADQQTAAGDKAIATQQAAAKKAEAAYAPYTSGSANTMGALNAYMGFPNATLGAGGIGDSTAPGALPASVQTGAGVRTPGDVTPQAANTKAVPRDPAATPQTQAAQATQSSYTLGGLQNGGMVKMQAPNGTVKLVPREQAPFYAQRGAVEMA